MTKSYLELSENASLLERLEVYCRHFNFSQSLFTTPLRAQRKRKGKIKMFTGSQLLPPNELSFPNKLLTIIITPHLKNEKMKKMHYKN